MRLNKLQARILRAALPDSWLPATAIAKRVGCRAHTVHYTIRRLQEQRIIRPFLLANPHKLGLTDYCVFFNYTGGQEMTRAKIIKYCSSAPSLAYLGEHTGAFRFSASLFTRSVFEVEDFFKGLSRAVPAAMLEKSLAIRAQWITFPRGYLSSGDSTGTLVRGHSNDIVVLDGTARQLLASLGERPERSFTAIAKDTGVPESTVRHRLLSLKAQQVIISVPYWLDALQIGRFPFRLLIDCGGCTEPLESELITFARKHPSVSQFVRCFGAWDFELNAEVSDPQEVNQLVDQVLGRFGTVVRGVHTLSDLAVHVLNQFPAQPAAKAMKL